MPVGVWCGAIFCLIGFGILMLAHSQRGDTKPTRRFGWGWIYIGLIIAIIDTLRYLSTT